MITLVKQYQSIINEVKQLCYCGEALSPVITIKTHILYNTDHGNPPEDVQMQLKRRGTEVFPITIEEHIKLLRECGFRSVDLLWTSYLQAGFWAVK